MVKELRQDDAFLKRRVRTRGARKMKTENRGKMREMRRKGMAMITGEGK